MTVSVYIARNHLGQFSCGHGWVDDFEDGRFYTKRSPVSSWVTSWALAHPDDPVPEILMWTLSPATADIALTEKETKKRVAKVNKRHVAKLERRRLIMLNHYEEEAKRIEARKKELMK